jgi:multiple sugar transport system ATP-binding protein
VASVTFEKVRKSYDDVEVIKGVDLTIADGEFLVLVGPSGCGKSTLMRLVAGLEEITAGTLSIGDRVVNEVPPRDRGVAMVFQSYALYPHMTVRENMAFGLEIRKMERSLIEERVAEAARLLGLEALLDRYPKQMSGGQRQRVAMGRAIVRQPEVFLFDEPLSNLDAALRAQMRVELKKLHRRLETTMIYVTHDQVEAMTLADRIAVIHEGIPQQVGAPGEIFDRPANEFVASFIGSPSMNFFVGDDEGSAFVGPGFEIPLEAGGISREPHKVGVRPQHLGVLPDGDEPPAGAGLVEASVDVVEPMGWEAYLHMHVGEQAAIAHVEIEEIEGVGHGDELRLYVESDKIHLFDEEGRRIAREDA